MRRYIDVDEAIKHQWYGNANSILYRQYAVEVLENAPTVDVVSKEQYEDLREAFIDFVCSGVHNPAPYCKNACAECVDSYGWCTYKRCNGFNPDGRVYD